MIKICGLTTEGCVDCCQAEGVDAVGFNFYSKSPRYVSVDQAKALRKRISVPMQAVGVFVRPGTDEMKRAVEEMRLDVVQLHGTDHDYWHDFVPPPVPLWLAHGISSLTDIEDVKTQLKLCRSMNVTVTGILIDARVDGLEGGTGTLAPWHLLQETTWSFPLILAGGLSPGNIRQAIEQVGPQGVDVASGVESSPGVKDPAKVQQFVRQAREAFRRKANSQA